MYASTKTTTAKREMRYTVTPVPADAGPADDFGFSEDWQDVSASSDNFESGKTYSPTQQRDI